MISINNISYKHTAVFSYGLNSMTFIVEKEWLFPETQEEICHRLECAPYSPLSMSVDGFVDRLLSGSQSTL